ncbi:MAG TPA: trehalose-6-phosphate synthase [Gaiellaceae bacterium]|nr:trehalose-6-phosphate synthase [Gaiellaceae bacterium]
MQLIVVSNRGPVAYDRDAAGKRIEKRGAGGLVTALRGLVARHDVTWIASAISDEDRVVAREPATDVVLVAHDAASYRGYYDVIANPLLWFVQHELWGLATKPELDEATHAAWHDYETVNRNFASAVVAELDNRPDAVVFFHDYHLYLAPRYVRDARPNARLAHFVHIPWPSDWSVLPEAWRHAVHDGLLANDVVGFHTERWCRNFAHSCREVLGRDATATLTHHPISVDAAEFESLAESEEVLERERELVADRPELLVLRVDRTDPAKNIVRGFHAFATLLDEHAEWHGRVRLLALLDPSRQTIPEYVAYREAIEAAARELEERHPGAVTLRVADDFPQSVAAYKQYDVLFVNSVYDGLNLVVKEGPLVNTRAGVVVLSENAGAYEELGEWVIGVNPFDVQGQADALHEALTLAAGERTRRAQAIREHVRVHDIAEWVEAQLADLSNLQA